MTIFQSIFDWSSIPQDFIDSSFAALSEYIKNQFPPGVFTSLLAEGIIPGLGGIVIFIPQVGSRLMEFTGGGPAEAASEDLISNSIASRMLIWHTSLNAFCWHRLYLLPHL